MREAGEYWKKKIILGEKGVCVCVCVCANVQYLCEPPNSANVCECALGGSLLP